jgi:histidyl-tRNA synthetase
MTDKKKLIAPRLPRGFEDRLPAEIGAINEMTAKIRTVYERYGFDPVETPLLEYTETLGKFLPDTDRPNAGVFSLQDDDEQWMSLRYDLTAPLARHFAENFQDVAKPYRSYRAGYVFRNEKPGPGRFRQFMQFDADTVGAAGPEADAEMCMMMADTMDALGLAGKYVVKVNNRKVLDGVLASAGVTSDEQKLTVLRAIDKLDKFGVEGVQLLLGAGRKDESGDFTKGAGLAGDQLETLTKFIDFSNLETGLRYSNAVDDLTGGCPLPFRDHPDDWEAVWNNQTPPRDRDAALRKAVSLKALARVPEQFADTLGMDRLSLFALLFDANDRLVEGLNELASIETLVRAAGYGDNIEINPSVVRGLEYYTGPVFEIELTFKVQNEKGQDVVFGSVGGGGRYDGLVSRFRSEPVPATGFSIGVSRLANALKLTGNLGATQPVGPVVVLVMDKEQTARYQAIVSGLRKAGIRAEMFMGNTKNFGKQVSYADKRNSPAVIIEGSQEREQGIVQIKDMFVGKEEAKAITDNAEYKAARPGQFECAGDIGAIIAAVKALPAVAAYIEANR